MRSDENIRFEYESMSTVSEYVQKCCVSKKSLAATLFGGDSTSPPKKNFELRLVPIQLLNMKGKSFVLAKKAPEQTAGDSNTRLNKDTLEDDSTSIAINKKNSNNVMKQYKRRYTCECGKEFKRNQSLNNHRNFVCGQMKQIYCHMLFLFICAGCEKQYKHRRSLWLHQKYECGKKKSFVCQNCGKSFWHKQALQKHMNTRTCAFSKRTNNWENIYQQY
ncbi:hypothetical protein GWI33_014887 [Rhynchophorus ferrugineus]|uniref:C2H2-type domain-containing protein n=1 Tax=Rhynchophorus ferrugineus TaxID=354439 RepID=A0A834M6H1_RHYFE|nr:hypothetical protein GWI33_014887 [Rhynchophorus ferrugineus]